MFKILVKFTRNHRCLIYPPFTKYKTQYINTTTFFFWTACFKEGVESNLSLAPDIGLYILKFNKTGLLFCKIDVIGSANGGVYSNARSERMNTRACMCVCVCVWSINWHRKVSSSFPARRLRRRPVVLTEDWWDSWNTTPRYDAIGTEELLTTPGVLHPFSELEVSKCGFVHLITLRRNHGVSCN